MRHFSTRAKLLTAAGSAAAAVSLGLAAFAPAYADTGSAHVVGTGTISPGLTTTPTFQTFGFTGTAAITDASDPTASGTYACSVNGASDIAETNVTGHGSFAGRCVGQQSQGTLTVNTATYTRTGGAVQITNGDATAPNGTDTKFSGDCAFTPTSNPTDVTSFAVHCDIVFQ